MKIIQKSAENNAEPIKIEWMLGRMGYYHFIDALHFLIIADKDHIDKRCWHYPKVSIKPIMKQVRKYLISN